MTAYSKIACQMWNQIQAMNSDEDVLLCYESYEYVLDEVIEYTSSLWRDLESPYTYIDINSTQDILKAADSLWYNVQVLRFNHNLGK